MNSTHSLFRRVKGSRRQLPTCTRTPKPGCPPESPGEGSDTTGGFSRGLWGDAHRLCALKLPGGSQEHPGLAQVFYVDIYVSQVHPADRPSTRLPGVCHTTGNFKPPNGKLLSQTHLTLATLASLPVPDTQRPSAPARRGPEAGDVSRSGLERMSAQRPAPLRPFHISVPMT